MTKINIGTSLGNITNYEIDKPYEEITFADVNQIVKKEKGMFNCIIYGWGEVEEEQPKNLWQEIQEQAEEVWEFSDDTEKVISLSDLGVILKAKGLL